MARKNNFLQSLLGRKVNGSESKKSIPIINDSWRNDPYNGFTDNMLNFLLNYDNGFGSPIWQSVANKNLLTSIYENNPVVNAIINIKAKAWATMRFVVVRESDGERICLENYNDDGGKLKSLLLSPNPIQNGFEWLSQWKLNYGLYGNSYCYKSMPVGFEDSSYMDISVLNNISAANIMPKTTGMWLNATRKDEIISHYEMVDIDGKTKDINTNLIWHSNVSSIKLDENFAEGVSKLVSLRKPLSNIVGAFETRNVMIYNRGALGYLSPDKRDEGVGSVALDDTEIEDIQKRMDRYGTMNNQYNHIVSPIPMKYQRIAMSPRELLLFEEIESDAIAIANAYGVPELLVKYYIKGATFENLEASEKRFYDSTIIPEAHDFVLGLNNFLNTSEEGIRIEVDFDHIASLQSDKKAEAMTNQINATTRLDAFKNGAIIYNDYITSLGLPMDSEIGNLRIWDLSDEQLSAIGVNRIDSPTNASQTTRGLVDNNTEEEYETDTN